MTDTTELIDKAEVRDGKAIVAYSRTEHALAILRDKYKGATYDLTTTAGDKAARAARLELKTLRTDLEKKRAELKAPALLFGKTIDSEAARLTAEIQALETPIDAQIKADEKRREDERIAKEQAEAARRKVHTDGIAKIAGYVEQAADLPAARIAAGITYTVAALRALHAKAVAREEEAARLDAERIEQARIAAEQAETARKLKEQQDELDRQRAEVQQREERIAAEERAKLEREALERAAAERLQAEAAAAAERAAQAAAASPTPAPTYPPAPPAQALTTGPANVVPMPTKAPADDGARINLSDIKDRLHPIQITAEGLASLGFPHVAQERASKQYRAADFPRMCDALIQLVARARDARRAA